MDCIPSGRAIVKLRRQGLPLTRGVKGRRDRSDTLLRTMVELGTTGKRHATRAAARRGGASCLRARARCSSRSSRGRPRRPASPRPSTTCRRRRAACAREVARLDRRAEIAHREVQRRARGRSTSSTCASWRRGATSSARSAELDAAQRAARRAPRRHVQERRPQRARRAAQRSATSPRSTRSSTTSARSTQADEDTVDRHRALIERQVEQLDASRSTRTAPTALDARDGPARAAAPTIEDQLAEREALLADLDARVKKLARAAGRASTPPRRSAWPTPPASTSAPSTARRPRSPSSRRR